MPNYEVNPTIHRLSGLISNVNRKPCFGSDDLSPHSVRTLDALDLFKAVIGIYQPKKIIWRTEQLKHQNENMQKAGIITRTICGNHAKIIYSMHHVIDGAAYMPFHRKPSNTLSAKEIFLAYKEGDKQNFLDSINECNGLNVILGSEYLFELCNNRYNGSAVQLPINVVSIDSNTGETSAIHYGSWYMRGYILGSPQFKHGLPCMQFSWEGSSCRTNEETMFHIPENVLDNMPQELLIEHGDQEYIRRQLGWIGMPVFDGNDNGSVIEYTQEIASGVFNSARFIPRQAVKCLEIAMLGEPESCGVFDMLSNMNGKPDYSIPVTCKGVEICRI